MRLGIDASNLRAGGGVTHLVHLLAHADPAVHQFERVVVWAPDATLAELPKKPWLELRGDPLLNRPLPFRLYWQRRVSGREAGRAVDVLFVPGGSYTGTFRPFVTMFRNMLPFSPAERRRYGVSWRRVKLALLERGQTATFRRANGVIALTDHARDVLMGVIGEGAPPLTVIPHGVDRVFIRPPNPETADQQRASRPFRLLYVSTVDAYKHQWNVAEAAARIARKGAALQLDLIGSPYPAALRRLQRTLVRVDPGGVVRYHGTVAHAKLPAWYHDADGFVFASTCENMPNILLEAMAAGLPIACSDRAPMPDVLGDAGVYFDPESVSSVERAIQRLVEDPALRRRLAEAAYERSRRFTWERCADETFAFIRRIVTSDESSRAARMNR